MQQFLPLINLLFHLFMAFIVVSSAIAIFALLRFGQSRLVGLASAALYISILALLYSQAVAIINRI